MPAEWVVLPTLRAVAGNIQLASPSCSSSLPVSTQDAVCYNTLRL